MVAGLGSLRGFFSQAAELGSTIAPALAAGAALTGAGPTSTLARASTAASILGGTQQGQATAVSRQPGGAGQETAGSGEMGGALYGPGGVFVGYDGGPRVSDIQQANALSPFIAPGLNLFQRGIGAAGRFLQSPMGVGLGAGVAAAPVIIDQITGQPKKLRVTRKMQREVKNAVMLLSLIPHLTLPTMQ